MQRIHYATLQHHQQQQQHPEQQDAVVSAQGTTAAEASKMLEAALQQMDGIISGAVNGSGSNGAASIVTTATNTTRNEQHSLISATNVLSTAKTLALALEQVGLAAPAPDTGVAAIISDWLDTHIPRQDADERLHRLQRDKESLALQLQALAHRAAEQADRIVELERLLADRGVELSAKEEQLQRQMLSRSELETQKLELMSALSELKLHRTLDRENTELLDGGQTLRPANGHLPNHARRSPFGSLSNLHQHCSGPIAMPKTPPSALRHKILPQFHSLPRSHAVKGPTTTSSGSLNNNSTKINNYNNNNRSFDANTSTAPKQRNVMFASNEKILIDDDQQQHREATPDNSMTGSFISSTRPPKGLRNIFGKLRRSNSGNLELPPLETAEPEFKRGGARATAAGRIEWSTVSPQTSCGTSPKDYASWSAQEVCNWLSDLGLGCYEDDCKKWLKTCPQQCFFTASPLDIDRELGLKSSLHRKKILLAIDELTGKEDDPLAVKAAQLDVSWVLRWLDDIGLPQYKEAFQLAKVDGACLHRLTMEDLAQLHVSSCLHIASLRRGIQCMREMHWNPECLIRRSTAITRAVTSVSVDEQSEVAESATDQSAISENIALWTAHRVMEWLRVLDLSEYAPNLRGGGVHGALMLYERRFNVNLLADLLSIPTSKTLLRRHLATHFKDLLGREVIQGKRDAEATPGHHPLTLTAKLKPPKKAQFTLKRRKSTKGIPGDVEWSDYVCPMGENNAESTERQHHKSSAASASSTMNNSN